MMGRIMSSSGFDGNDGYVATGSANLGLKVVAGDADGDGYDELVTGSPDIFLYPSRGQVMGSWGGSYTHQPTVDFSTYVAADCKGFSFSGGRDDVSVGASLAFGKVDGTSGIASNLIVFASLIGRLYIFKSGSRAYFSLSNLDSFTSANGYLITDFVKGGAGVELYTADLNADGADEIIGININNIEIIWGRPTGFPAVSSFTNMTSSQRSTIYGSPGSNFASALAFKDLNYDGRLDMLVGALGANKGFGAVYGYFTPLTNYPAQRNDTDCDFQIVVSPTDYPHAGLGSALGVVEITGDNRPEIVVCGGAAVALPQQAEIDYNYCAVFIGQPAGYTSQLNVSAAVDTSKMFFLSLGDNNANPDQSFSCIGQSNSIGAIDTNNDGIKDLYIPNYCSGQSPSVPASDQYVNNGSLAFIYGKNTSKESFLPFYNRTNITGSNGWIWEGTQYSSFGFSVTQGNFDGGPGLAVGEPFLNTLGTTERIHVALSSSIKTGSAPTCAETPTIPYLPPQGTYKTSDSFQLKPLFYPEYLLVKVFINSIEIPKPIKTAMMNGAVKGASNVVGHALEQQGYSQTAKRIATGVVYYGGAFGMSYYNRYNELATSGMTDTDKNTTAAYQALGDVSTLVVTQVAFTAADKLCSWLGGVAEQHGWKRTSSALSWISQTVGYGSYAAQAYQQGVASAVASIASGVVAEKVVTQAGKELIDICVTPIQADAYRKSNKVNQTFFAAAKPVAMAEPTMQQKLVVGRR